MNLNFYWLKDDGAESDGFFNGAERGFNYDESGVIGDGVFDGAKINFPKLNSEAFKLFKNQMTFKKIISFETEAKLDEFFRTQYPLAKTSKSQIQGCSECSQRKSGHKMRMKLIKCGCSFGSCSVEWKINKCETSKKYVVYEKGYDIHTHRLMIKGSFFI